MKSNNPRHEQKVALITGAGRRLGAVIARRLHANHYRILIHYHQSKLEAESLSAELNAIRPSSAATLAADLANFNQLSNLIEKGFQTWNRLDVLVNNAAIFVATPVELPDKEIWDRLLNTNLTAPYFLSLFAAPYLQKTAGTIIQITDIHGQTPLKGYPIYSIAKSGLSMATQALARELAPTIRVNAIAPGITLWAENKNSPDINAQQDLINRTALKRIADPEDIAKAVLFLIDSHSMTGQILNIDGGRLLRC